MKLETLLELNNSVNTLGSSIFVIPAKERQ